MTAASTNKELQAQFAPAGWASVAGRFVFSHENLMLRLGEIETRCLSGVLEGIRVDRPIYVCGLARSGSTVILEALAKAQQTASHLYQDYPFVYTPFWWSWFLDRAAAQPGPLKERTHGDGIAVSAESPEAMEEPLWRTFFPDTDDNATARPLTGEIDNPRFDRFYEDHVRKMLAARGARRYLAKGNYNIVRMPYIKRLFPDARFVVPVRAPEMHVASLMRQHARFMEGVDGNKNAQEHLRRVGHFEFGPLRRPIAIDGADDVVKLWSAGEEVRGWARLWALVYGHAADVMSSDALGASAKCVRHEDLTTNPISVLGGLWRHCELDEDVRLLGDLVQGIRRGDSSDSELNSRDRATIREETDDVAARFGYY